MKLQVPRKALTSFALVSTLAVLVAVLGYLSLTGRPSRPQPRPASQASVPLRKAPTIPPASTSSPPGAGQAARTAGGQPSPAMASSSGTPPAAGAPGGVKPVKPGSGTTAPTAQASQPAASSPGGTGPAAKPASAAPASTAQATPQPNPEAAVVGAGQRGRSDPFSPLTTAEHRVSRGPLLPPLPGVGLPMPPGFATPGGPGATPPPLPGSGMRVAGIMGSRSRVAIIESEGKTYIVGVGERVGDAVVISILSDKIIMKQNNVTFELAVGGDRSS